MEEIMLPFSKAFPAFLLIVPVHFAALQADEPQPVPLEEAKILDAVRKAAKDAEVHGIGISCSDAHGFGSSDVTNWPKFAELLRRKEGPAGRIWELLPKKVQDQVSDDKAVAGLGVRNLPPEARRLMSDVEDGIRKMLVRPDFYTEKAFKDVPLDKNLKDTIALGEKRTHLQTLRLNRVLLATAFPDHIAPVPVNYHLVPVLVKAGKPVILVLTSYKACHWQVELEEGAEVVGIILGGTEPQEVAGVKAPVVYRAGRAPDWKDRKGDVIWTCHNANDKSFAQLEAGVKKITGKTFTDFQGKNTAPKDGFVVKPSAK